MHQQKERLLFRCRLKQRMQTVGQPLMKVLTEKVSPAEIYASDDMLVTDPYFSLLHFATGEETVTDAEWKYLLDIYH